jgi:hypothetical protein
MNQGNQGYKASMILYDDHGKIFMIMDFTTEEEGKKFVNNHNEKYPDTFWSFISWEGLKNGK